MALEGIHGATEDAGGDAFSRCVNRALDAQERTKEYAVVRADAEALRQLSRDEVFVKRVPPRPEDAAEALGAAADGAEGGEPLGRLRFYRNMMPDITHIALSQPCGRFFHEEDFEFAFLKAGGKCPFSRVSDIGDYGSV